MNNEELINGIVNGTVRPGEIIDNFNHFIDTMSGEAASDPTIPESVTRAMENARISTDTVTMPINDVASRASGAISIGEIIRPSYYEVVDQREERIRKLEERVHAVEEANLKYAKIIEEYKELKDIFARLRDFYQETGLRLYDNV